MDDKESLKRLEQALSQMLRPLKGLPFPVIVKSLSGKQVIQMARDSEADRLLLIQIERAIQFCAAELKSNPIRRPRPNEVGNDIEPYVMRALKQAGLITTRPTSKAGAGRLTGYPDILVSENKSRHTYLECKSYTHGTHE